MDVYLWLFFGIVIGFLTNKYMENKTFKDKVNQGIKDFLKKKPKE